MVVLGQITAPFGIKGWFKVHSHTVERTSIFEYSQWNLQPVNKAAVVDQWQQEGKSLIAHISGIDDRNAVQPYIGSTIEVDANQLPELGHEEYYWHQLEGLNVIARNKDGGQEILGVVSHLIETGSNDVLVVNASTDSIDQHQRLIPWLPESTITSVDLELKIITVDWDSDF